MNRVMFTMTLVLFFTSVRSEISFKSISSGISSGASSLSKKAKDTLDSAKDSLDSLGTQIRVKLDDVTDEISSIGKQATENLDGLKSIFMPRKNPIFCQIPSNIKYAPTMDDPEVLAKDTEGMIPIIKKYSPILYLCNELYYPMAVEELFTTPYTQLVYQPDHSKNSRAPKTIVLGKGQVTMEKIYEMRNAYPGNDLFFEIEECIKSGSDPKRFSDKSGNLTTPIYVTWSEYNDKIYIVYGFMYGFNGAYPISMPMQGSHDFDLEHITLELNKNSKELERIFFAAHSSREGVWLPKNHKDIGYEGTHPIVHSAQTGHGSYPRMGTHIRGFGFANDITCKTKKWVPQLVLVYPDNDPRFDAKTMGWVYHSGDYGREGVGSFKRFFQAYTDTGRGMPHANVQFCPNPANPNNPLDMIKYQGCIESKRLKATIP